MYNTHTTSDNLTEMVWSRRTIEEGLQKSIIGLLAGEQNEKGGTSEDSFIQILPELNKNPGDTIRMTLFSELVGRGKQGSATLKGDEESISEYTQDIVINERRHATKYRKGIDAQRIGYSQKEIHRKRLSNWLDDLLAFSFLNQVCAKTNEADTYYTGNNTVTAPDSNHIIRAGARATDELVQSNTDEPDLTLIDDCVAYAQSYRLADSNGAPIRPGMFMGQEAYVFVCHPYFWNEIKTDTAATGFLEIAKAFFQGMGQKNPITQGSWKRGKTEVVGYHNGTFILTDPRCPQGINSTTAVSLSNTRRGVFMGAQAAGLAFGQSYEKLKGKWSEDVDDYGKLQGYAIESIFGLQKCRFNSIDLATIVVTGYTNLG